jgi:hypothetical protein
MSLLHQVRLEVYDVRRFVEEACRIWQVGVEPVVVQHGLQKIVRCLTVVPRSVRACIWEEWFDAATLR